MSHLETTGRASDALVALEQEADSRRAGADAHQGDRANVRAAAASDETRLHDAANSALEQNTVSRAKNAELVPAIDKSPLASKTRRAAEWASAACLSQELDELETRLRGRGKDADASLKSALKAIEGRLQALARRRDPAAARMPDSPQAFAAEATTESAARSRPASQPDASNPAGQAPAWSSPGVKHTDARPVKAVFPFKSGLLSHLNAAAQGGGIANRLREPGDAPVLSDTQNHIAELARKLDNMCRDAAHSLSHASERVRGADGKHGRDDIPARHGGPGDVSPASTALAHETAIGDLNPRVETLDNEDRRRASSEQIDRLTRELPFSIAKAAQPSPIERKAGEIKALGGGSEDLSKSNIDPAAFSRMQKQTEEIHESLAALAARPLPIDKIERQIARLTERLESQSRARSSQGGEAFDSATNEILTLLKDPTRAGSLQAIEARLSALACKAEEALKRTNDPHLLDALSRHIEATQRQLTARFEAGLAASSVETNALKDLVGALAGKIGAERDPDPAKLAVEALEREIAKIVRRLDRADEGFASLTAIEQSIAALFAQIEETRRMAGDAAEAARSAARDAGLNGAGRRGAILDAEPIVTREIADLRALHEEADRRLHLTLTAVQETVGKVADRLAKLETDLGERRPGGSGSLLGPNPGSIFAPGMAPRQDDLGTSIFSKADLVKAAAHKAKYPAANGTFPRNDVPSGGPSGRENSSTNGEGAADVSEYLIEPGAGLPRQLQKSAPGAPPAPSYGFEAAAGRADFIAAARRAAQAAQQDAAATIHIRQKRDGEGADEEPRIGLFPRMRRFCAAHKRPVILSLAALFLGIGAYALAKTLAHGSGDNSSPAFLKQLGKGIIHGDAARRPESTPLSNDRPAVALTRPAAARPGIPGLLDPSHLGTPQALAASIPPPMAPIEAPPAGQAIAGSAPIVAGALGSIERARQGAGWTMPLSSETANSMSALSMSAISMSRDSFGALSLPAPHRDDAPSQRASLATADAPETASADPHERAEAGDAAAQFELALRFAEGREAPRDVKLAAHWYDKAALQGFAPAQYRLALLYEKGLGVPRDLARAAILYRAAAEQGNTRAMHNLGVLAAEGADGRPDYATAALWFGRAAEFGVRDSQFNLAVLLSRGLGAPQDLARSYAWFAIAAADGDAEAGRKRDEIGAKLAASDLASAKTSAEAFRPRPANQAANASAISRPGSNAAASPAAANALKPMVSGL